MLLTFDTNLIRIMQYICEYFGYRTEKIHFLFENFLNCEIWLLFIINNLKVVCRPSDDNCGSFYL